MFRNESGGWLDEIYRRIEPARLFQKLALQARGRRWIGTCPRCGKREAYVLRYDPRFPSLRVRCNRQNKCGYSASAWEYLRDEEGIAEERIFAALAERAGVDLARTHGHDALREAWRRRERRAELMEAFLAWAGERLWSEAGHAASEEARTARFLAARGYSEPIVRAMGLVFLPPADQTRAHLLSSNRFTPEDLQNAAFLDRATESRNEAGERVYTLAIPYPEAQSLVFRATLDKSSMPADVPKYRYPKGLRLVAPAYLRAVDKRRPVLVVEGFLDACLAHALAEVGESQTHPHSITQSVDRSNSESKVKNLAFGTSKLPEDLASQLGNFVATGTNRLNAAQVEALRSAGVREVVLSFDSDAPPPPSPALRAEASGGPLRGGAGEAGTLASLDRLAEAGTFFPRVLRIPPELGCKDPDEVLVRHGVEAFARLLVNETQSEASFRAAVLLRIHGLAGRERQEVQDLTGDPRTDALLAELAGMVERESVRAHRALYLHELLGLIAAALGVDREALAASLLPFRRQAALQARADALRSAAQSAGGKLHALDGDEGRAREELAQAEEALRAGLDRSAALAGGTPAAAEPISLGGYVAELSGREEILASPFGKLDEAAAIHPGRITLVAARPSHGKTTFLVNLLVHWLKLYPEKRFVFFSYDGPRAQLISQIVSRLTRRYALRECEDALRGETAALLDHPAREHLMTQTRAALDWLRARGTERRVFVVDRALTAKELCASVREIGAGGPLGAVFVDYIQQIRPEGGKRFETRQREVGYVSRALQALAQETGVPVVAAAQLNRLSESPSRTDRPRLWQLREAGDLEQDATTVYGLYNHHQALSESSFGDESAGAASVWQGGNVLGRGNGNGNGNGNGSHRRGRRGSGSRHAGGIGTQPDPLESFAQTAVLPPPPQTGHWTTPNALRAVPLDVEVLKAKHGRTHVRIALSYDMVANYITDGKTDGGPEVG